MQVKVKRSKAETVKAPSNGESTNGSTAIAPASLVVKEADSFNLYETAIKELVALSENDQYAKKVDTGPLSEARGKDTWQLHTQLRMLEEFNKVLQSQSGRVQAALSELDNHLHQDTVALSAASQEIQETLEGQPKHFAELVQRMEDRLYQRLFSDVSQKFEEIKDTNARLIDKRFNQTEIAFASVRADVEVVKALLTDIIKSRIGRGERQQG